MDLNDIAHQIRNRKNTVERGVTGDFLAMDEKGTVRNFATPQEIVRR